MECRPATIPTASAAETACLRSTPADGGRALLINFKRLLLWDIRGMRGTVQQTG